jgi:hypothetical protein
MLRIQYNPYAGPEERKRSGSGTLNVCWPSSGGRDILLVAKVWSRGDE